LEGREGRRRLTPAIVGFIEFRFEEVYAQHRGRYNLQLREEVQEVFKVKLSGETLRPLLKSLVSKRKPQPEEAGWVCPESLAGVGVPELPPIAEIPVSPPPVAPGELGCELAGGTGLSRNYSVAKAVTVWESVMDGYQNIQTVRNVRSPNSDRIH
jgi:hypothetical protein